MSGKTSGLHVEAHGQGSALLLTHGFGATSRMWDEQVEEFTNRHQLILWDLPGHGESPAPDALAPEALVRHMAAILDGEKIRRAVLVGLGLGGLLSLRFWRAHPDRVRGLILIGTQPGLRSAATRALANVPVEAQAKALETHGLDALEGGAEADPRLHANANALAAVARALLIQTDTGALPWLAEIDVPTLILAGGDDKPCLSAAHYMARVIPGAREIVVPRANHAANLHKPDAVNAAIAVFLGRLRDQSPVDK